MVDGTVFFDVTSYPGFGELSGLSPAEQRKLLAERGGDPDDPRKRDPLDFVVWQRSQPGEPWWDSPWGRGRPGWHLECSAMARRHLGVTIDLHGGGADLVYPHHESERAQSESANRAPFARRWLHTGMVGYQGEKMSSSLGNLNFPRDLFRDHVPAAVRLALHIHLHRGDGGRIPHLHAPGDGAIHAGGEQLDGRQIAGAEADERLARREGVQVGAHLRASRS